MEARIKQKTPSVPTKQNGHNTSCYKYDPYTTKPTPVHPITNTIKTIDNVPIIT